MAYLRGKAYLKHGQAQEESCGKGLGLWIWGFGNTLARKP